jgi:hypothetical protein
MADIDSGIDVNLDPKELEKAKKLATTRRWCLRTAVVLMICGSLAIIIGLVSKLVIPRFLETQVLSKVIIDSVDHSEFYTIKSNTYEGAAAKYNKIYLYDMKNPNEFIHGQKPEFVERGLYVFREYYSRNNFEFSADKTLMSYSDSVQNVFVPEQSNGSLTDIVNMINLPYVKVMSALGGETEVLAATGPKILTMAIAVYKEQLVPGVKAGGTAMAISTAVNKLGFLNGGKEGLIGKMSGLCAPKNCSFATTIFFRKVRVFLNTTLCSEGEEPCQERLSFSTMQQLLNESNPYSVTNTEEGKGVNLWLPFSTALLEPNKKILTEYWNLTDQQFNKLHGWLVEASNAEILKEGIFGKLKGVHKVNTWEDLAYRQWVAADIVNILKNNEKGPLSLQPSTPPEFPFAVQWLKNSNNTEGFDSLPWSLNTVDCIFQVLRSNESCNLEYFWGKNHN